MGGCHVSIAVLFTHASLSAQSCQRCRVHDPSCLLCSCCLCQSRVQLRGVLRESVVCAWCAVHHSCWGKWVASEGSAGEDAIDCCSVRSVCWCAYLISCPGTVQAVHWSQRVSVAHTALSCPIGSTQRLQPVSCGVFGRRRAVWRRLQQLQVFSSF